MKRVIAFVVLIFIIVCAALPAVLAKEAETVDGNFRTLKYDTEIILSENNVYHVKEHIVVNFTSRSHGIYRYIPYIGSMQRTLKNGNIIDQKYRTGIKNIKVDGENFETEKTDGNVVIKVGDADIFLSGKHEYNISYDIDAGEDKITDFDRIYIDLIPTGWRTSIDEANFKLTLPKAVDRSNLTFYLGRQGASNAVTKGINVDGNVITGSSVSRLNAFTGMTLHSQVEEGYFTNERTDTHLIIIIWTSIILIPLLGLFLFILFGRDGKIVKVMSVSPPKDMTPAEVGYIMDSTVNSKDVLSLIIYWADKGYLAIADDNENVILTKLQELPQDVNGYEENMFSALFKESDVVDISDLKENFYKTFEMVKVRVANKFKTENQLYTKASNVSRILMGFLSFLPIILSMFMGGYVEIIDVAYIIIAVISVVLILISYVGFWDIATRWYVMSKKSKICELILSCCGTFISYTILIAIAVFQFSSSLHMLAAVFSSLIAMGLTCFMRKRTKQCSDWLGELLGLREFIELAEKERIEQLVFEDPSYFYNILPYAYVMGVSDVWSKKFESIIVAPPSWYSGSSINMNGFNTYLFFHSFNHSMSSLNSNLSIPPASTSGGGVGGGHSGGFSGGGMGGGGGGSW